MAPFAEGGRPPETFASTREAGHVIQAWEEGQVGRVGSRPSDSNRDVHLNHAWTKIRPAKSEFPEAEHLCFSQSIIFLPLSLTSDLDDGLGLGHLGHGRRGAGN